MLPKCLPKTRKGFPRKRFSQGKRRTLLRRGGRKRLQSADKERRLPDGRSTEGDKRKKRKKSAVFVTLAKKNAVSSRLLKKKKRSFVTFAKKKRSVVALAYAEHTRSKQKLNRTSGDVLRAHVSLTSAYFSRLNCDIIRHLQHRGGIWLFLASCDKGQASPKSASQAKPSQAMMEEIGETGRTYYTAGAKLEIG